MNIELSSWDGEEPENQGAKKSSSCYAPIAPTKLKKKKAQTADSVSTKGSPGTGSLTKTSKTVKKARSDLETAAILQQTKQMLKS